MRNKVKKPKICFISSVAYHILRPESQKMGLGKVGGSELQVALLSKALVKEGFDVSLVTADYGQRPLEIIDGIKIIKGHPRKKGLKELCSWLFLTWRALNRADADVYYPRPMAQGGSISLYCFLKRKKLVYPIYNDMMVSKRPFTLRRWRENISDYLVKLDMKLADILLLQTEYQKNMLSKNLGKDGIIIKSICPLPASRPIKSQPPIVLWVANLRKVKQPELFLKLAAAIPETKFQMIGGIGEEPCYYELIKEMAARIPNLKFIGPVPYPGVNQYFDKASIFVNTSTIEGFPNTFLQAWARYTPVVSLNVNPDGIIGKCKLGTHSKTFEQMVKDVKFLVANDKLREVMGLNGRRYVEKERDTKRIINEYKKIFLDLIAKE